MLGAAPVLDPDLTPPPTDVRRMLQRDAEEERTEVKNFVRLASLAEQDGLFALMMKTAEQAVDEDGHGMRRLLG
jgi:bacterioferritin